MAGSLRCCWLLLLLAMLAIAASTRATSSSCPTVCSCKWKGGKQTVECVNCGLITVPTNVHPETQVLEMSGNNLQILPRDLFVRAGLLNLQKVYMRRCRVGEIHEHAFRGLTNLVELDLSNNLLTSVPSATFRDIQFLREIVLANNPIQKIENSAFRNLPNLVKLDLSNCEVQTISTQAFENVEQLASLKLNGNRIAELKPKTVDTLSRLHGIELHDNPWHCDCRFRATKLWLTHSNIAYTVAPLCHSGPARVAGHSVAELSLEDFACPPEIRSQKRIVEASVGDNATLECRVYATPVPSVQWYWNGRQLVNNSAFGLHQQVYVFEKGGFDRHSSLVLTNVQEADSSDFICTAENRAGSVEVNFTLHVSLRTADMSSLRIGQITGLSAALVVLVLLILLVILVLLLRLRFSSFADSKTPVRNDSSALVPANASLTSSATSCPTTVAPVTASARKDDSFSPETASDAHLQTAHGNLPDASNTVEKPPRLTEGICCSGVDFTSGAAALTHGARGFNNPDLIEDTRPPATAVGIATTLASTTFPAPPNSPAPTPAPTLNFAGPPVFPITSWESTNLNRFKTSPDVFIRRAIRSSSTVCVNYDACDKSPIIGDATSFGGASEDETDCSLQNQFHPQLKGYPPDYGLPIPQAAGGEVGVMADAGTSAAPALCSKTPRVWQRGVPLLPPVTALKRVLSNSRNQDDCGTDV